jgi:Ferritin-like domain
MEFTLMDPESERRLVSRRDVLRWAALGGGALAVGAAGAQAAGRPSAARDARVLNLVLLLEYTESAFYREAVANGALRGELLEFAKVVGGHEQAHVAFLKGALGKAAVKEPKHDFGRATRDPDAFAAAAIAIEETAVATYDGQATNLTRKTLAAAATIASVEARHAAWIRHIVAGPSYPGGASTYPAPNAFDAAKTKAQVEAAVGATGFITG